MADKMPCIDGIPLHKIFVGVLFGYYGVQDTTRCNFLWLLIKAMLKLTWFGILDDYRKIPPTYNISSIAAKSLFYMSRKLADAGRWIDKRREAHLIGRHKKRYGVDIGKSYNVSSPHRVNEVQIISRSEPEKD